jgi:NhaA family Na+:H+ antiporter
LDTGSGPGRPALDGGQLIGELAFGAGTQRDDHVKVAILTGSLLAAMLLRSRHRL